MKHNFSNLPKVNYQRSRQNLSYSAPTTANQGEFFPFYIQEIYPGDSLKVQSKIVCRTPVPFLHPIFGNLYLDTYYFYVPNRFVMDDWSGVFGDNKSGYWTRSENAVVPLIDVSNVALNSVADHFGLPVGSPGSGKVQLVNALPFRAFALIWNEWLRDENSQEPVYILKSSADSDQRISLSSNSKPWSVLNFTGMLPRASRSHDYFSSCLPSPQKGSPVEVAAEGAVPVVTGAPINSNQLGTEPLAFRYKGGQFADGATHAVFYKASDSPATEAVIDYAGSPVSSSSPIGSIMPSNLYADFEKSASTFGITVNALRTAFQTQRLLEKNSRFGTRYCEYVFGHFGVNSGDLQYQRPEFLGGKRIPIQLQQVTQTSASSSDSPLGQMGAFSLTNGSAGFRKSFTEHGFVIGVACVRQIHMYEQGIERFWLRNKTLDYYDPVFSHIGEQPVYQDEIMSVGLSSPSSETDYSMSDRPIFGYQEAWADLRTRVSRPTGYFRATASNLNLSTWLIADRFASPPVYNSSFVQEPNNVDNVLTAPSTTIPNFIFDIYHQVDAVRVLPAYSTPGLIDHH